MDKHVAERWVQALRSGQYQQGKQALRPTPDSYCCLGVLCDLYRVEQGKGAWDPADEGCIDIAFEAPGEDGCETSLLPIEVKNWAGMRTNDGRYGLDMSLAGANDEGAEFPRLADLIEQKWEVL
jgi:hypothetical protein